MIENPGTCSLRYAEVPINRFDSCLDWGICSSLVFLMVCGGITALPTIHQVLKHFNFLLGPWYFWGGSSISAFSSICHSSAVISSTFSEQVPLVRISSIYFNIVSHLGEVRLTVRVQQVWHEQLWVNLTECGSLLKVYCIPPQVKANLFLSFCFKGNIKNIFYM